MKRGPVPVPVLYTGGVESFTILQKPCSVERLAAQLCTEIKGRSLDTASSGAEG
jgi:hypothetical protein